ILARPASRSYQLQKFAHRNRVLVSGIAAVFGVLLAGAITSSLLYLQKEEQRAAAAQRGVELAAALATAEANLERALGAENLAEQEEGRARTEAETAQAVTDYLVTLFEYANPEHSDGKALNALDLLDQGVERIRGQFQDQPAIRARLLNVFGKIDNWLQRYERSRPILEEALALTAQVHGEDSAEYADTLERLAWVHHEAGDARGAEGMQRRVLALREKHVGRETQLYADALNNLANTLIVLVEHDEARELVEESHALRIRLHGPEHESVAASHFALASLYGNLGRPEEAGEHGAAALAGFLQHLGPSHWRTLLARAAQAEFLRKLDRPAEAVEQARLAVEGLQQLFGPDSLMTTRARRAYAGSLADAGRLDEAALLIEELLVRHEELHGRDADYGDLLMLLASTLQDLGRLDEAESLYLDTLEQDERLGFLHAEERLTVRHNLSVIYADTERLDEALELELAVLAEREPLIGLAHPDARGSLNNLAAIYRKLGRAVDEEQTRRKKLSALLEARAPYLGATRNAREELAEFLERTGRSAEAQALHATE
ncbi:MAG: tetratricopeptide repeat protein, partial [Planctomycetes bacterium]|nr:tetratricopeptide repeat protein [Planctomycetota bacterium]